MRLPYVLGFIVTILAVLAFVPADRRPPPRLEVWLNPWTGEFCCEPGSRIHRDGEQTWVRRPGFTERTTYVALAERSDVKPCRDCEHARCFVLHYSLLATLLDKVWGYKLQEKWLRFDDQDEHVRWLFRYHNADGTAAPSDGWDYEVINDPNAWFR